MSSASIPSFDQFVKQKSAGAIPTFDEFAKQNQVPEQTIGHAASNYWDQIKSGPANLVAQGEALMHPIDTLKGYGKGNAELAGKAMDAYKAGNYQEAARHGLNYMLGAIPGLGQSSEKAGNELQQGDVAGGVGTMAGMATNLVAGIKGPGLAKKGLEKVPLPEDMHLQSPVTVGEPAFDSKITGPGLAAATVASAAYRSMKPLYVAAGTEAIRQATKLKPRSIFKAPPETASVTTRTVLDEPPVWSGNAPPAPSAPPGFEPIPQRQGAGTGNFPGPRPQPTAIPVPEGQVPNRASVGQGVARAADPSVQAPVDPITGRAGAGTGNFPGPRTVTEIPAGGQMPSRRPIWAGTNDAPPIVQEPVNPIPAKNTVSGRPFWDKPETMAKPDFPESPKAISEEVAAESRITPADAKGSGIDITARRDVLADLHAKYPHDVLHDIVENTHGVDSIKKVSTEKLIELRDRLAGEAGIEQTPKTPPKPLPTAENSSFLARRKAQSAPAAEPSSTADLLQKSVDIARAKKNKMADGGVVVPDRHVARIAQAIRHRGGIDAIHADPDAGPTVSAIQAHNRVHEAKSNGVDIDGLMADFLKRPNRKILAVHGEPPKLPATVTQSGGDGDIHRLAPGKGGKWVHGPIDLKQKGRLKPGIYLMRHGQSSQRKAS